MCAPQDNPLIAVDPANAFVLSLSLGVAFGLVYGVASFLTYKVALKRSQQTFMMVAFGGMALRLMVAAISVALMLAFAPVDPMTFISSFFAVFAMALTLEVTLLHRRQTRQAVSRS